VAKVIDFGIAKARDRMAGETNAGVLKGKIQYMAPEQALGRKVDRRADLWAIGATMYHLLTGKPPYEADNTLGTLHLLTSGRPPLPLPPSVPPAIAAIARKALTALPEARFQSAAQMRDAMEAAMIEAKVPATTADVASFLNRQLADRTAKRRQVVDIALAAAAERERIQEVLKPQMDRTGSGLTSAPASERTLAEAPGALRPVAEVPSAPSTSASTQRTPAGTVASEIIALPRTRRTGLVVALVAIGLAAAAGVAFVTLRQPAAAAAHAPQPAASLAAPSSVPSVASASPSSTAAPSSSIPEFSLSDLPKAGNAAPTSPSPPPRQTWQAPRPPAAPGAPPANPPKKKVDDGF
jgi:serine/threonine protein kinase